MSDATVNAVGFGFSSPEVIVLFADHDRQHLHIYPSKKSEGAIELSDDGRENILMLLSLNNLSAVEGLASGLHRVLLFGKAEEILGMGVPVIDSMEDESGRLSADRRQTRDTMLKRIEDEAVPLVVTKSKAALKRDTKRTTVAEAHEGPTLRSMLKGLRASTTDSSDFNFPDDVGTPTIVRLMGDVTKKDYKAACKQMIAKGGADRKQVQQLFRWVEGVDGVGPELGRAVDAYLYPDSDEVHTAESAAKAHGVPVEDVKAVAKVYRSLQENSE